MLSGFILFYFLKHIFLSLINLAFGPERACTTSCLSCKRSVVCVIDHLYVEKLANVPLGGAKVLRY